MIDLEAQPNSSGRYFQPGGAFQSGSGKLDRLPPAFRSPGTPAFYDGNDFSGNPPPAGNPGYQGGGKVGSAGPDYGAGAAGGGGKSGGLPPYLAPMLAMAGQARQQGGKSGGQPPAYGGGPHPTFSGGQPYFQPRGTPPWMQPQNPAASAQTGQYGLPSYATAPVAQPYVAPPPPPPAQGKTPGQPPAYGQTPLTDMPGG